MVTRTHRSDRGFTLVELTIAMAMFTVVLGATAQALISYYAALDFQNQRSTGLRHCTAVISQMRQARAVGTSFPSSIVTQWPNGQPVTGLSTLPRERITVNYVSTTADPLQVTVTSEWRDIRGRLLDVSVTTMLTGV